METNNEIDISAISYNLSLPVEKRLEQHQAALEVIIELEKASQQIYEES